MTTPRIPPAHSGYWVDVDGAKPYTGNGTDTLEFDQIRAMLRYQDFEKQRRSKLNCFRALAVIELLHVDTRLRE